MCVSVLYLRKNRLSLQFKFFREVSLLEIKTLSNTPIVYIEDISTDVSFTIMSNKSMFWILKVLLMKDLKLSIRLSSLSFLAGYSCCVGTTASTRFPFRLIEFLFKEPKTDE